MRKILLIIIIVLIFVISIILIYPKDEKQIMNTKYKNRNNMLSIMVESETGTGNYIDVSSFPSTGYYLNKKLSKCVNGSKISFSEGQLTIKGNKTDRCYAYFDKDELGSICRNQSLSECFIKNYQKDSSIIYHDGKCDYEGEENCDLEAGDLSYRYSGGKDIVHNYVCLDSKTTGGCETDDDLYRIIGLFKNNLNLYEIKLLKNDYITKDSATAVAGAYYAPYSRENNYQGDSENLNNIAGFFGNSTYTNNSTNMWKYSNLNKDNLNQNFYQYITGKAPYLSNNIVKHSWTTGGMSSIGNAKITYENELGSNKVKSGDLLCYSADNRTTSIECQEDDLEYFDYIGLLYISDFMYAASDDSWNIHGDNYDTISSKNWMYMGLFEWSISRMTTDGYEPRYISWNGRLFNSLSDAYGIYGTIAIRPVFYIDPNLKLVSGDGTSKNPYRITIE